MRYYKPEIVVEGLSSKLIESFGGSGKNPSVTDNQGCSFDGICPAESDE